MIILEKDQEASYKVSELILKAKKPNAITRTLLMPACKELAKIILGPEAATEILTFFHQLILLVARPVTCQLTPNQF
jgi:hypothetical protein